MPSDASRWRRVLRALVRLGQGLLYHDAFRVAPAMAFHFFLSLLPLLAFIGYVIGLVARQRGGSAALDLLLDNLNLPPSTEAVLKNEVGRLASVGRLGPVAAIGFLWIASGGMQGLMVAVETVVGSLRRAWWKQRVIALGWVVATLLCFGVAAFGSIEWEGLVQALGRGLPASSVSAASSSDVPGASPSGITADHGGANEAVSAEAMPSTETLGSSSNDSSENGPAPASSAVEADNRSSLGGPKPASSTRAESDDAGRPHRASHASSQEAKRTLHAPKILRGVGERIVTLAFSLAAAVAGLCAFYRFAVTHAPQVRRRVLPGALVAVASWLIVSWGFSLYLRTLASYAVYYGGLAAVAVLLVWLWLVSLAILVGAELNAQLEGLRDELRLDDVGPPSTESIASSRHRKV